MRSYSHAERIKLKNLPTQTLVGLETEKVSFFNIRSHNVPVFIQAIGITYPTPNYSVSKMPGDTNVIEYVVKGKGYIYADKKVYTVKEGDIYILRAGTNQRYAADMNDPYEKQWINFTSPIFDVIFDQLNIDDFYIAHLPEFANSFSEMCSLADTSVDNDAICYKVAAILFNILLNISQKLNEANEEKTFAASVRKELDAAVYTHENINDIASKMLVSRQHLTREFKKQYGITPYQYLINQKLSAAKKFLIHTNFSVKFIAQRLGFDDENHFSSLFKDKVQMSPTRYKQLNTATPPRETFSITRSNVY